MKLLEPLSVSKSLLSMLRHTVLLQLPLLRVPKAMPSGRVMIMRIAMQEKLWQQRLPHIVIKFFLGQDALVRAWCKFAVLSQLACFASDPSSRHQPFGSRPMRARTKRPAHTLQSIVRAYLTRDLAVPHQFQLLFEGVRCASCLKSCFVACFVR